MDRNLKASLEWSENSVLVKTIDTFDLPPRTSVELVFPVPLDRKAPGLIEEVTVSISAYKCLDCTFVTTSLGIMKEHQKSGKHSLGRRIKRFFAWSD